jgi:hypothetical protein
MDPASAEVVSSIATALAITAVFGALFAAVLEAGATGNVTVKTAVPYIAILGVVIFLAGRALRYHFAGY